MKTSYFLLAGLLAIGTLFTGCSDDKGPDNSVAGDEVYFANDLPTKYTLARGSNSLSFDVRRVKTGDDINVLLDVTDESGFFNVPPMVSFKQGQDVAKVTVTYDLDKFTYDVYEKVVIKIKDESFQTPYGNSTYTFTAGVNSPWTSLGTGTYFDYAMIGDDAINVTFEQNDLDEYLFRMNPNPYIVALNKGLIPPTGVTPDDYFEFRLLQPGDKWGYPGSEVTITMNDLVGFRIIETGSTIDGSNETALYPPYYFGGLDTEDAWTDSYVRTYQESGLPAIIEINPVYYLPGWMYNSAPIEIVFPGVVLLDTSVSVKYLGLFTSADDEYFACGSVTLGDDVQEVKVAAAPGIDALSVALAIIDGSLESVSVTKSGEVRIPLPADAASGKYSLVAVSYVDGEAQEYDNATFTFAPGGAEKWNLVGTGTYAYNVLFGGELDEGLEFYQSDSNPTHYKITDWCYGVDFCFTMQEDGSILVDDQETGYNHKDYGMIYVVDLVTAAGSDEYGSSYYQDGVFTFAVDYYCSLGNLTYGNDTFTLDAEATAAVNGAAASRSAGKGVLKLAPKYENLDRWTLARRQAMLRPLKLR